MEEIRSAVLRNSHLWARYRKHKQGILDVLIELADGTKVNVEMQIKSRKHWTKRQLFYIAKMYTEDLKYHTIYRMCDETGEELSDMWEAYIIELRKE